MLHVACRKMECVGPPRYPFGSLECPAVSSPEPLPLNLLGTANSGGGKPLVGVESMNFSALKLKSCTPAASALPSLPGQTSVPIRSARHGCARLETLSLRSSPRQAERGCHHRRTGRTDSGSRCASCRSHRTAAHTTYNMQQSSYNMRQRGSDQRRNRCIELRQLVVLCCSTLRGCRPHCCSTIAPGRATSFGRAPRGRLCQQGTPRICTSAQCGPTRARRIAAPVHCALNQQSRDSVSQRTHKALAARLGLCIGVHTQGRQRVQHDCTGWRRRWTGPVRPIGP
jgi:hypothetical protein